MFYSNIATVSNGSLLSSGGMFYISATQGNHDLKIAPGKSYNAQLPIKGTPSANMFLFGGLKENGKTGWIALDTTNRIPVKKDTSKSLSFYNIFSKDLKWINCDQFNNQAPNTVVQATIGNTETFDSKGIYLIFKDINTADPMQETTTPNTFVGWHGTVPLGLNCTVVGIGYIGKKVYAAFLPTTITNNMNPVLKLVPMDESTFDSNLKALD
jgi:hypothetical protein